MIRNFFYLFSLLTLISIQSCTKEIRWEENLKNKGYSWAGKPDALQTESYEYFYMKRTESVKEIVLIKKNDKLNEETCSKQSLEGAKPYLLQAMITDSIPKTKYITPHRLTLEQNIYRELKFDYKQITPQLLKCEPITYELKKSNTNVYDLCECVVYFHYKGGAELLEKKFENYWRLMDEKFWLE